MALVVLNLGGDVVDTSTAIGKLLITVLTGIAEFEADLIKERQIEGIAAAKARGVYQGRPPTPNLYGTSPRLGACPGALGSSRPPSHAQRHLCDDARESSHTVSSGATDPPEL